MVNFFQSETKQNMENTYGNMTQVEHSIADFFMNNTEKADFSSKRISKLLYVSEATLSRFAKKCGYKGYREFIYSYEKDLANEIAAQGCKKDISFFSKKVQNSYHYLLQEDFRIMNENQIKRIVDMLDNSRKVLVYGLGSSGYVALEFQFRFMRIGLEVDAITDPQMMQMSAALADKETLVIAISLSGKTKPVVDSAAIAKRREAGIVFITSDSRPELAKLWDEVLLVSCLKNLSTGTRVSPQFPILVMVDVLYSYYFSNNSYMKVKKYNDTLSAIKKT